MAAALAAAGRPLSHAGRVQARAASASRGLLGAPLRGPPLVHDPLFSAPARLPDWPAAHRFPMGVFERIHSLLLAEGIVHETQVVRPPPLPAGAAERAHSPEYLDAFRSGALAAPAWEETRAMSGRRPPAEWRRVGLPWSETLVARTFSEAAGTLHAARLAMQHGVSCSTAGGTHHAHASRGGGFCAVNDLAITALELLATGEASRVLIVDCDVHHGDGTAAILGGDSAPSVFTMSLHCADNWPLLGKPNPHPSDLDVELPPGAGDREYTAALEKYLPQALGAARPCVVLYDAGVDVHRDDSLGLLEVSDEGLRAREKMVLEKCLSWGAPVACYVGGGYHRSLDVLAARHAVLHQEAQAAWERHCR